MIVVVADETELEGAEQIVGAALRDQAFQAGGVALFRCHVPESRGGSVEVDALVCTPQSVTIVEVKGFTARQEGTLATPPNGPWTIDGEPAALYHAVRVPNPFVQVRRQVFAAKSLLQQSGIFGWVNAVIALVSQPGAEITIEETRIADGYRAVLVDRDDASALHDYFQAESGRTVRLSIDDVTRVFAALNLGHLLPTSDELMAQGFPATLDSATTARPVAPTAVELGTPSETAGSATPARSTGSSPTAQAATPAFLAAIDRLAHRSSPSARPEESTTPAPGEDVAESPTEAFTGTTADDADNPTDNPAESATETGSLGEDDTGEQQPHESVGVERSPSAAVVGAHAGSEVAEPSHGVSEDVVSLSKSPAEPEPDSIGDPSADEPDDEPSTSADSPTARHEPTAEDDDSSTGTPTDTDAGPADGADAAIRAAATVGAAAAVGSAAAAGFAATAEPTDAVGSTATASPPATAEPTGAVGSTATASPPATAEPTDAVGSTATAEPTDAVGFAATARPSVIGDPEGTSGPTVGAGSAASADSAVGAGVGGTGSWSTPSTAGSTPAFAPSHQASEPEAPQQNPEHWSDWVERDRTTRRPTLPERWRAWRRGNGPSLIERWHNRPVRERTAPRRGLRVGPGVALLLFIALFGAGFFAIAAVQASRFEMSDYDRMCGEDKKPFPNAAPYQRDGARPIYLSGDLTTMVNPGDPTAWNPRDPSTVQLIACMKQLELRDLVQTCQYGPAPGAPIGRTVNLFRATYEVAVYELRTGREVAKATMLGERYSANPSNTDPDRCRAAADAPDYLGRRLGQPSTAQLTGFLAPLVHADRTTP